MKMKIEMINAKEELLKALNDNHKSITCAIIRYENSGGSWGIDEDENPNRSTRLMIGHTPDELKKFMQDLNFNYDNGYGIQKIFGTVWCADGTWFERGVYDGSEWWEFKSMPQIPDFLISEFERIK